jgi:hypothetical protein
MPGETAFAQNCFNGFPEKMYLGFAMSETVFVVARQTQAIAPDPVCSAFRCFLATIRCRMGDF